MKHGWVYIYESPPASKRFEELVRNFTLEGISLADPATGRVTKLSPIGEQLGSSEEELVNEFELSRKVSFNLYLGPSDGFYCSIKELTSEVLCESYSLCGRTVQESDRIINILTNFFRRRAESQVAFGFVVDEYAEIEFDAHGFQWDHFVLGSVVSPPMWPLVLGFSKSFANLSLVPQSLYASEEGQTYVLFRRSVLT